jgi:hypothetical protein
MPYIALGLGANVKLNNIAGLFWEIVELAINIICTAAATWKPLFIKLKLIQPSERGLMRTKAPIGVNIEGFPPPGTD